MQKFLLYSSALVLLSGGEANAACIQTPSCSSLGYDSSTACDGGIKCPFGNAWNCTGPNNTTEINSIKTQINSINTSITNILNRITKLENNSGSGSGSGADSGSGSGSSTGTGGYSSACSNCSIGQLYYSGYCVDISNISGGATAGYYYVYAKEGGKCKAFSLYENVLTTIGNMTQEEKELSQKVRTECTSNSSLKNNFKWLHLTIYAGYATIASFGDGDSGSYDHYLQYAGCSSKGSALNISGSSYGTKAQFERDYNNVPAYLPKEISF